MGSTLPLLLLVPAVAGLIAFVWPTRGTWVVRILTVAVAVWLLVMAARLFGSMSGAWQYPWIDIGPMTLALDLLVTPFGAVVALFVAAFGVIMSVYSIGYTTEAVGRLSSYVLWTLAAAIGGALANNLLLLLVCWEIVTLMLFLMINLGGEKAKAGAAKTFAILGLSDCAMLLGIVLLVLAGGQGATLAMDRLHVTADSPIMVVCFLLFLAAALAKAGAMPLHTWIPAAAEGAPCNVMAFLPASLDKLLGIYLLARVSLQFFELTTNLKLLLMIIGAATIVGAVMMAMVQHDLKKLLSFHAISQVGYMVLGIGTGMVFGVAGGIFHMINHSIYKSCLFLTAGSVEKQTGTTDLDRLGGLARVMPLSFFACVVAALAISGVPPMNGFASKWMIYQAALGVPSRLAPVLVAAAVFGSALTLASFVKVIHSVFLGGRPAGLGGESSGVVQKSPREAPFWMTGPMIVLALACLGFGIFARVPLARFVEPILADLGGSQGQLVSGGGLQPSIERIGELQQSIELGSSSGQQVALDAWSISTAWGTWEYATATVLLLAGLVIGVLIFVVGGGLRVRRARSYIGGEKISERSAHYSGTGFYGTVRALPGIKSVYNDAEGEAFDVYHIGGRFGGSLVGWLRRCQTGVLSLYVSWVVLGLIIILVYLLAPGVGVGGPGF